MAFFILIYIIKCVISTYRFQLPVLFFQAPRLQLCTKVNKNIERAKKERKIFLSAYTAFLWNFSYLCTKIKTMNQPKDIRNRKLAEQLIRHLEMRHFEAHYCPDTATMKEKVRALIPAGSSISWGGSMSIRDTGLTTELKASGEYQIYDREDAQTQEEKINIYRKSFECDFYLSSVNAISEDGVIVNIDGNGNRVAAITWGPKRVIFIVGMNKVTKDVDAAWARARSTAAPINAARFDINTPCQKDGICHSCHSPQSICNYVHFLRNSYPEKRHVVILVGEDLGY